MVERFEFTCPDCDPDTVAVNHGRYVRHSDYEALEAENAELATRLMHAEARAALAGSGGGRPVPEGWKLVPVSALKWLNGEGPDADGHWFGDAPEDGKRGAFWWRSKFSRMLTAAQEDR